MKPGSSFNRRDFLKVSGAAGGGLLISVYLSGCAGAPAPQPTATPTLVPLPGPDEVSPDLFVRIARDGIITVTVHRSEMGQGVRTALPMILAEELGADWQSIRVEQADGDPKYGDQLTGGSVSMSTCYTAMRRTGALARDLLVTAAAQVWESDKSKCAVEKGTVINSETGERLPFGYLVPLAATLPAAGRTPLHLKDPSEFKIIGSRLGRIDEPDIVTGKAVFGMDVRLPGMLYGVVAHNPVIDGTVAAFDEGGARQVPGVVQIVPLEDGVAVVAQNTWSALQGRDALTLTYDDGRHADYESALRETELLEQATSESDSEHLVAYYTVPFLAHAPMEPMNCVADARSDRCEVWVSTQNPQTFRLQASGAAGTRNTILHVPLVGGGFGRRLEPGPINYVVEAIQISQAVAAPVKLFWTRADDMQHEYYHPLSVTRVDVRLDDPNSLRTDRYSAGGHIPTGALRSVENIPEAFARQSFLDEYAFATKQDPVELRRKILFGKDLAVLELAAAKSGWGTPLPAGHARGIAFHSTWGATPVAQVAEVSVDGDGIVRVHRVVCGVDCGIPINPSMIEAQMEGGIVFGLTHALKASVSIQAGRVQETDFNSYPLLRMDEAPAIEVYIVPSTGAPSGIGEMANPVIMPAVANAVFAATGKRIRHVPIRPEDLKA